MSADVSGVLDVTDLGAGVQQPRVLMRCSSGGGWGEALRPSCLTGVSLSKGHCWVWGPTTCPLGDFWKTSFLKVSGADWKLPVEKVFLPGMSSRLSCLYSGCRGPARSSTAQALPPQVGLSTLSHLSEVPPLTPYNGGPWEPQRWGVPGGQRGQHGEVRGGRLPTSLGAGAGLRRPACTGTPH